MKIDKTIADLYSYRIRNYTKSPQYKRIHSDVVTEKGRMFGVGGFAQYLRSNGLVPMMSNLYMTRMLTEIFAGLDPIVKPHSTIPVVGPGAVYWWYIRSIKES